MGPSYLRVQGQAGTGAADNQAQKPFFRGTYPSKRRVRGLPGIRKVRLFLKLKTHDKEFWLTLVNKTSGLYGTRYQSETLVP